MPINVGVLSATLVSSKPNSLLNPTGTSRYLPRDDAITTVDHDMGRARHAGIERANCAQNIDPLESALVAEIVFYDWRVEDRLLVRSRSAPRRLGAGIHGRGRDDLVVR